MIMGLSSTANSTPDHTSFGICTLRQPVSVAVWEKGYYKEGLGSLSPRCFLVVMEFTENQNVDRISKFYMSEKCGVFIEKGLTLKTVAKTSVLLSIIHILTKKQRGIGMTALRAISI